MWLPTRVWIIGLVLAGGATGGSAQAQTKSYKTEPVATVSGKVTIKGKPAAGVIVGMRLTRPEQYSATFKGTTDQDGIYHITDVAIGSYVVAPVLPTYVISDPNNDAGLTVVVTESEKIDGINFELVRGGVITGRITDTDGQPLIEQPVIISITDSAKRQVRAYRLQTDFRTDDRGIYRIFGIRPGSYKVSVGLGDRDFFRGNPRTRQSYPTTYYPGATDETNGRVIEIGEGGEVTGIDITVGQPAASFSVSGRIVEAETGAPIADVQIGLSRIIMIDAKNSESMGVHTGVSSNAQGEFRLSSVRPGKYGVSVETPPDSDLGVSEGPRFEVIDQDVTGLLIQLSRASSISGVVVFEAPKKDLSELMPCWISAYSRSGTGSSSRGIQVKPDGTFKIGGLPPGLVTFGVGGLRKDKALRVSRVERDGVLQPNGIEIQNARDRITGLRVVVVEIKTGGVRGAITFQNGALPAGAQFTVQLGRLGDPTMQWVSAAEVDARGHFSAAGLPAGDYELTVFAYVPGSRQRPFSAKQMVTVTEGGITNVTVALDLAANPNP